MCHNSVLENEQIDKCIENGMPSKLIKTIKYTIRKREAANEEIINQKHLQEITNLNKMSNLSNNNNKINNNEQINAQVLTTNANTSFISKCPFGHGKFTTPTTASTSSSTQFFNNPLATTTTNSTQNWFERFPQISQLTKKFASSSVSPTTTNNGNTITNLSGHNSSDIQIDKKIYNDDILAKSTQLTRELSYKMQQALRTLQTSKIYTMLTKTTQPAHLVAIAIVSIVLLSVWPELIDGNSSTNGGGSSSRHPQEHMLGSSMSQQKNGEEVASVRRNDMLALIAYLGAFSTHFGAQIWMTFVSGLSLYFSLPRHMFGQCQQILFPKYFAMNATLSITMLIIYVKFFLNTWSLAKCMQLGSLALTGAIELLVRLYLAPPLLRLMHEKYKIEGTVGSGKEVGSLVQGDLIKCPHYQRIHKSFRRIHMTVAIGNMLTMAGSCLQLYYLAGQLQISIVN